MVHQLDSFGLKLAALLNAYAVDPLSPQEVRLAALILRGYSNSEMAADMHLAPSTVKTYRKNLYSKLQIHSRRQLFDAAGQD